MPSPSCLKPEGNKYNSMDPHSVVVVAIDVDFFWMSGSTCLF